MSPKRHPSPPVRRVREPVQVYLDAEDRELLEQVARSTGLARAEVLRRGLRSLAAATLSGEGQSDSLSYLIGALGEDESTPADLAAEHDRYLAQDDETHRRRSRLD